MCAYSDYNDVATVTEEMFRDVAQKALGRTVIKRNGEEIDLAKPWKRITMRELILERFGLDFMESTREQLAEVLDEPMDPDATWAEVVADIYSEKIESTINQPTHVFDFPLEPFPITKRHPVHPELGEHFDAVIGGIELVSGDTELNDPVDQWQRFVDQRKRRMIDDADVPHPNDEEYARAIEYGYSPTAGGGMGVDRLVMILTERDTLREVIPFPIVQGPASEPGVGQARPRPRRGRGLPPGRAAQIADEVAEQIAGSTTVSVERSVTRLLGVDGADELEVPLPNVLVDHVHDARRARPRHRATGSATRCSQTGRDAAADRRGGRAPASSTCCALEQRRGRRRSASGSPSECAARLRRDRRSASSERRAMRERLGERAARRCATC